VQVNIISMQKKIVFTIFCILLIGNSILTVVGSNNLILPDDEIDQYQESRDNELKLYSLPIDRRINQSFVPSKKVLTRIQILSRDHPDNQDSLYCDIVSNKGEIIASEYSTYRDIYSDFFWIEFNFWGGVELKEGTKNYIVLYTDTNDQTPLYLGYSSRDLYINGSLSMKGFSEPYASWLNYDVYDLCFRTFCKINSPPEIPSIPKGPDSAKIGEICVFETETTDIDDDKVSYLWDWDGDYKVDDETQFFLSGKTITKSHSWDYQGMYEIRVKAKDINGYESSWSDPKYITIPQNKIRSPFSYVFSYFPLLYNILNNFFFL